MGSEKRHIHVTVSPETYMLIVKLVYTIYGGRKGAMSELIEDAVKFYSSHIIKDLQSKSKPKMDLDSESSEGVQKKKFDVYIPTPSIEEIDLTGVSRKNPVGLVREVYESLIKIINIESDFNPPAFVEYRRLLSGGYEG